MKIKHHCCFFILVFAFCITGFCQFENRVFRKVSHPQLKDFYATGVYKPEGKGVWFFSNNHGLAYFDGNDIVNFRYSANDSLSLSSDNIRALAEDSRGNLWVGTMENGLNIIDKGTGKIEKVPFTGLAPSKNERNIIMTMLIDDKDNLFIGLFSKGFLIVNTKTRQMKQYDNDTSYLVTAGSFAQDKRNKNLYWITSPNGLYVFDILTEKTRLVSRLDENKVLNPGALPYLVTDCLVDDDDNVWFLHFATGLYMYDQQSKKVTNYAPYKITDPNTYYFFKPKWADNKNLFVSETKDRKRYLFNIEEKKFTLVNGLKGLPPDRLPEILWDSKSACVWDISGGEVFFSSPVFSLFSNYLLPYDAQDGFSFFFNIKWEPENLEYHLWQVDSTGIYTFDSNFLFKNKIDAIDDAKGNLGGNLISYEKDGSGRWWISTDAGVQVLLPGRNKAETVNKIFPRLSDYFHQGIYYRQIPDKRGNIYSIGSDGKIELIDHNTMQVKEVMTKPLDKTSLQTHSQLKHIVNTKDGKYIYYIKNDNQHIIQVDLEKGQVKEMGFSTGDQPNSNVSLAIAEDGRLITVMNGYILITDPQNNHQDRKIFLTEITPGSLIRNVFDYKNQYLIVVTSSQFISFNYQTKECRVLMRDEGYHMVADNAKLLCFIQNNRLIALNEHNISLLSLSELEKPLPTAPAVIFTGVSVFNQQVANRFALESGKAIELSHKQNTVTINFSSYEYEFPDRVEYSFRMEGTDTSWIITNNYNRSVTYANLSPGHYQFQLRSRRDGGKWSDPESLKIRIIPAFWQTTWFKLLSIAIILGLVILFYQQRIRSIRIREQQRSKHEKELLELEARALRAQMNPHFIFNCMNSIKALIQNDDKQRSIEYLTTFSKLIRTLFQNSDKRQISLYDELETCRLYTQLEAMRLNGKLKYNFDIDPNLDLKSVMVPALIIQPFIENAIWHGIVPKDEGTIRVTVKGNEDVVMCEVDDDGIGREMSKRNRPITPVIHESKGVHLSQVRLNLEKMLNETNASIETTDKYQYENSTGTRVVITFNLR